MAHHLHLSNNTVPLFQAIFCFCYL